MLTRTVRLEMDWRTATIIGQALTILAMALVVSSRIGNADENVPRIFGVDSLLLGAVLVLLASTLVIVYAATMNE